MNLKFWKAKPVPNSKSEIAQYTQDLAETMRQRERSQQLASVHSKDSFGAKYRKEVEQATENIEIMQTVLGHLLWSENKSKRRQR